MDAQSFLSEFGHIVNAAGGVAQLRQMILQLAVTGRLNERVSDDVSADEIIEENSKARARLVAHRLSKRAPKPTPIDDKSTPWLLPEGWRWTRLGAFTNYGEAAKVEYDDVKAESWVLELEDIEKITSKLLRRVSAADRRFKSSKNAFPARSVLYGKLRPYLDKVLISEEAGVCSTEIAPISFYDGLEAEYLRWYLKSPYFVNYANQSTYGMNLPRFGTDAAREAPLPIPPIKEQRCIVAKIDELMALCDTMEAQQQDKLNQQDGLRRAATRAVSTANNPPDLQRGWKLLNETFSSLFRDVGSLGALRDLCLDLAVHGRLIEPVEGDEPASALGEQIRQAKQRHVASGVIVRSKSVPARPLEDMALPAHWDSLSLDEAISTMDAGWSPACLPTPRAKDTNWGVLKTTAVQKLKFLPDQNKELPGHLTPRPQHQIAEGDILITRAGPKNRVGICCVVDYAPPRLMISDKIIRFHIVDDLLEPRFVALCLSAGEPGRMLEEMKSGMAESQMNISQDKLRSITIPIPPRAEQVRILSRVEALLEMCDRLEEQLQNAADIANRLAAAAVSSLTGIALEPEEDEPLKAPQRELIAPVFLGRAPDIKAQAPLASILVRQGGTLPAKDLWQRFGGDIDAFYVQLKTEVAHGWIVEPEPATMQEQDAA